MIVILLLISRQVKRKRNFKVKNKKLKKKVRENERNHQKSMYRLH